MRVFHGIIEIAGQMGILSGALKSRGHIAVGYNIFHSYLGYQQHLINTDLIKIQKMFKHILNFFDLFHYHYGFPIWSDGRDLQMIVDKGKKLIMHHWGNDVRFHDMARIHNPYVYTGDSPPNEQIIEKLETLSNYFSEAIVQDYEVLPYVSSYYKKVHTLPLAINLQNTQPKYPNPTNSRPLILHAPTNPEFKGTAYIESAIAALQSNYQFDYIRIENMSNIQALNLYQKADIVIDQILCGSHGLLAVESMALGKPVIGYIRPDLLHTFHAELPILNANPDTIKEQCQMLLDNPALRTSLGKQGRMYVEKYHDRNLVIDQLLSIYANLS